MTGRVLVTVRCKRQGHPVARVLASSDGPRIVIPALLLGVRGPRARVHGGQGPMYEAPFESWMSYIATCDCNGGHLVDCARLQRAMDSGESRITVEAVM